jgi:uncharacterized membrane protein
MLVSGGNINYFSENLILTKTNIMKNVLYNVLLYFMASLLILFGIGHFFYSSFLSAFFPDFVPKGVQLVLIYITGVIELALGAGLILTKYRAMAANLTMWMFIAYLPLHIRDLFVEAPIAGSPTAAIVRLFVQFLFIYLAWMISKNAKNGN